MNAIAKISSLREYLRKHEDRIFLISMGCLGIYSIGYVDMPYVIYMAWIFLNVAVYAFISPKLKINVNEIILLVGMVLYTALGHYGIVRIIAFPYCTVMLCVFARLVLSYKLEKLAERSKIMLLVFAGGLFIQFALNSISIMALKFEFIQNQRRWITFWSWELHPATYHCFFALLSGVVVFYGLAVYKKNKIVSLISIFVFIYTQVLCLLERSRTIIAITLVTTIAMMVLFAKYNKENKILYRTIIVGLIIGCILVIAGLIVIQLNVDNENFPFVLRRDGGVLNNIRFKWQKAVLVGMFTGKDMYGLDNPHNSWLNIGADSGVIPFLVLVIYTMLDVIALVKLCFFKAMDKPIVYLVSAFYVAMFLYNCIEPAVISSVMFWAALCFLGAVIRVNNEAAAKD